LVSVLSKTRIKYGTVLDLDFRSSVDLDGGFQSLGFQGTDFPKSCPNFETGSASCLGQVDFGFLAF
jgi:hypothetical protein